MHYDNSRGEGSLEQQRKYTNRSNENLLLVLLDTQTVAAASLRTLERNIGVYDVTTNVSTTMEPASDVFYDSHVSQG